MNATAGAGNRTNHVLGRGFCVGTEARVDPGVGVAVVNGTCSDETVPRSCGSTRSPSGRVGAISSSPDGYVPSGAAAHRCVGHGSAHCLPLDATSSPALFYYLFIPLASKCLKNPGSSVLVVAAVATHFKLASSSPSDLTTRPMYRHFTAPLDYSYKGRSEYREEGRDV